MPFTENFVLFQQDLPAGVNANCKRLTNKKVFDPKAEVDRHDLSSREGGKELIVAEECVEVASAALEFYMRDTGMM